MSSRIVLVAQTVVLAIAGAANADAETVADRLARIEARIDRLEATADDQRTELVRDLVADVLDDADRRSWRDAPGRAGWNRGFFIESGDGAFRLEVSGRVQGRFTANHVRDDDEDGDRSGFEVRRARARFAGHIGSPVLTYRLEGDFGRSGDAFGLISAFVQRELRPDLALRVGQFKLPFAREDIISSGSQLAVDRSLVSRSLGIGRSQGVMLRWSPDPLRASIVFSDGADRGRTPFETEDTEWAATGRVEILLTGERSAFQDMTGAPGAAPAALLGAAVHVERNESGTAADETTLITWTVDGSFDGDGFTLYAAGIGRHEDRGDAPDRDRYGVVAQAGVFLQPRLEAFARYEWGDDDSPADDLSILTAGATQHVDGHRLKITADVGYAFNGVGDDWASSSVGWRASERSGEIVVRTQVQARF